MSKAQDFVHLHNHSEYSLLDGTTRIADSKGRPTEWLQQMAKEFRALAFTDHGNMYGAIEFYLSARQAGIKPILGMEGYIARGRFTDRGGSRRDNCHLTLLARDYEGYENLMALATKAHLEGFYHDPRIDKQLLREHSRGLVVLSGCLKGEVCQALSDGNLKEAVRIAGEYQDILGKDNYYIELMDHGLEKQKQVLSGLMEVSKALGAPAVATNDCHYAHKDDWDAHDARVCISTGKLLEDVERLKFESHEFYFKSAAEMAKLFDWAPEAVRRSVEIADKCSVSIPMDRTLLPHFEVPEGQTVESWLERLCLEGLKAKGVDAPEYRTRLEYELGVIKRMGFPAYFLIVWDFINFARREGIPVGPGRGSGAGSLTAYALDITRADPLKHQLLFERFLNPDRRSMPDLDIDFSDAGRERVIQYVRDKYGHANVAQIITFGSMNARLVVRDVGRILGLPVPEVDKLAKQIPFGATLHEALGSQPELKEAQKDPKVKKLFHLARKLEGLKRHTGVHAAGTVITKDPVVKYAPMAKGSQEGVVTTQYDDQALLKLGLLKVDFLGLRTLTIIQHAVEAVRQLEPGFDIETVPYDDAKTFELLQRADTFGVFQLESHGMRDLLRKLKPTTFQDISAVLALYRPGPMQAGMLDDFVARKHGHKKVTFEHPLLEGILKDTYGCLVYQEQVMEIVKTLAGFTPGEADGLRKAMGKKIPEEMEAAREKFVKGCGANGVKPKLADKIFDNMVTFGGYGFNKSHTVAYSIVSWQTAYLKAHYPVEFMAALLSSEIGRATIGAEDKENKIATYLEASRAMGIEVLPPDVNQSLSHFAVERAGGTARIRYGLLAVKNVGSGAVHCILDARLKGDYGSLDEFCRRVDLHQANRKVLESLIKAGAMDRLWPGEGAEQARADGLARLEQVLGRESSIKEDLASGQELLFGAGELHAEGAVAVRAEPLTERELLQNEKEVLGLYFSGHPLLRHKDTLAALSTHSIAELPKEGSGRDGPEIRVAGMIVGVRKLLTKAKAEPWARVTLEDLTGQTQVLVFPRAYAEGLAKKLVPESVVVVRGKVSSRGEGDAAELIAEGIDRIEHAIERWGRRLELALESAGLEDDGLRELEAILGRHPGPCAVSLRVHTPAHGSALIDTEHTVKLSAELFSELEGLLGEKAWRVHTG